jgi:chromosome segregation ATPase
MITDEQAVEELQANIEELQNEVKELELKKSTLVVDINAGYFKAQSHKDLVLTEANDTATAIVKKAQSIRAEADAYSARVKNEANVILRSAKEERSLCEGQQEKFVNSKLDFDSYKLATERNILENKIEAERLMSEAITLSKQANDSINNVNSLNATLSRKADELNAQQSMQEAKEREIAASVLNQMKVIDDTKASITELNNKTKESIALIEAIKIEKDLVAKTSDYNRRQAETIENQFRLLAEKESDIKKKFTRLDEENVAYEEKLKSLDEREQLLQIERKKVDDSIKTFKRLREEKGK